MSKEDSEIVEIKKQMKSMEKIISKQRALLMSLHKDISHLRSELQSQHDAIQTLQRSYNRN